jgi:hypothetical protein
MSAGPTISAGSFTPSFGAAGVTSAFGGSLSYRDGIFIRTQLLAELGIEQRLNEMPILKNAGERVPQVTSRKGQRYSFPTKSIPAVGTVDQSFTTSSFSYPNYAASASVTVTGGLFTKTVGTGASVVGIPVPLQRINEGEVILLINQYRGLGMAFTKEYLEISMIENPTKYYGEMIKYALNNDMETYAWLVSLFTGPITETADDYGTLFNDAIGITNKASNVLTRTLTSIGSGSNLITAQTTGVATGMSNSSNSRFGTSPFNVPFLQGSTTSDITYNTIARTSEVFDKQNVPLNKRFLFLDNKGYNDVSHLPEFVSADFGGKQSNVNDGGRLASGTVHSFQAFMTNVIQPAGASSNVLYELAMGANALKYGVQREPDVTIDNLLDKKERALILVADCRYGVVNQRPDHTVVIQTRTRT